MTDIVVPALGESVSEATVASWLKQEGDSVEADEAVAELETDKVTLEVNAPEAGVLSSIKVQEGETVEVGAVLGEIGAGDGKEAKKDKKEDKKSEAAEEESKDAKKQDSGKDEEDKDKDGEGDTDHKLSPSVRKLIDEHGLDPANIPGSGKDGRITKEDVLNAMEANVEEEPAKGDKGAPQPAKTSGGEDLARPSADKGPREERVKMTRLRRSIAKRLKEAQDTAAMLTTFNEVDMSAVMEARNTYKDRFEKKHGVKLGFMSFFVKACVNALKEFPAVNAEIDGDEIVYKNYYDISVAVSTPQGLLVPVIRDCNGKSMAEVEANINDLGLRAREGKIGMDELQGGTFTITNGGIFGSLQSTPILNPPQSGILGMHKIQKRPVVMDDGSIQARPMMYLALSYDHRIIDGREAVSFLVRVKDAIEDPQRLLLDI